MLRFERFMMRFSVYRIWNFVRSLLDVRNWINEDGFDPLLFMYELRKD